MRAETSQTVQGNSDVDCILYAAMTLPDHEC